MRLLPLIEPRGFRRTENFMKFLLICIVVLTATMLSTASMARVGPWGWLDQSVYSELNDQDWKLLRSTGRDILNNHPNGTIKSWRNENTGASGKIKVLTTEHKKGMLCRQTSFETDTANFDDRSVFLLCKTEDGTWKVAD
ncbi:hypothetical protein Noc_1068 [Nitrosococcus oceani ATCC 19707]|uniref:Surface antigen domain-containing protein n=4 Tax=Nitrosococcus oceani TaxID=1229 RepID=Q3JC70_NITOC|nr:hypothetical protein Noc_1068 [Nitrosococcus oceani ATCC 19707]KFI20077.1 hypothetical protein IB75_05490 [Nitrosococcus oceani C-27]KFI23170.1 hypothetical protein HW44_05350 [Nitrosococcus oceani]